MTHKKDPSNNTQAFGLEDVQRSANDQGSVRTSIEEWRASPNNPVVLYKLQGEDPGDDSDLLKEDFMIIIQTPFQKNVAQKFASKGICIDSTHGTMGYDLLLTIVMITFGPDIQNYSKSHVNFRSCLLASCFEPTTLVEMTVSIYIFTFVFRMLVLPPNGP